MPAAQARIVSGACCALGQTQRLAAAGLIWIGCLAASGPVNAAIYSVGSDAACDFNNIPGALLAAALSPGPDIIRIATNATWTAQALVIENQDVTLIGGYANCAAAAPAINASTTISGAGGATAPVMRIYNNIGTGTQVVLRNLRVSGGESSGVRVSGNVLVLAENVVIHNNMADHGGGLHVDASSATTVVLDDRSSISSNEATGNGGGIYCSGPGLLATRGSIRRNEAGQYGGGIAATNGCTVNVFPNNLPDSSTPGITENRAAIEGGGIDASGGTLINLFGTSVRSLPISSNRALDGSGGGIRALGAGTRVIASDTILSSNLATRRGGGIAISHNARLEFERSNACPRGLNCAEFVVNSAAGPIGVNDNFGGALAVWNGAHAIVSRASIRANSAANGGPVAWVHGSNSLLEIDGSVIAESLSAQARIEADQGGTAQITYSTFASSLVTGQTLLKARSGGLVQLYSSLVADQVGSVFDITGGGQGDADCVIAHETVTMPPSATRIGPATPRPALLVQGDVRLRPGSPAIDFCDIGVLAPGSADIDNQARGIDSPSHPNLYGTYDLGAHEFTGLGDGIFSDRFQ